MSVAIDGSGTTEAAWTHWIDGRSWPPLDLSEAAGRRVVVLAAHPDDEVLAVAGLMMRLTELGCVLVVVWATDGEASHPGSTVLAPNELAALRRDESRRALARLGVEPEAVVHLGLPDSELSRHGDELAAALVDIIQPGDVVVAPWERDGHPDHEAVGEAALAIAPHTWRYPIWMWHWAQPADRRVPWHRARTSPVSSPEVKSVAIAEFVTQVHPIGTAAADAAVLPPQVLARFARHMEWIIT